MSMLESVTSQTELAGERRQLEDSMNEPIIAAPQANDTLVDPEEILRLTSCSADYLSYVHAALVFAKPIEE